MFSIQALFEAHLNVTDLERAMHFYGDVLELELAAKFDEPKVAFYWIGGRGQSMLGLWAVGGGPQHMSLHVAFTTELEDVLEAPNRLRAAQIQPLDFERKPTEEAVVIGWMPAVVVYFQDPDGNLLEFLAMLKEKPRPEVGVVAWSQWKGLATG
jgi:lactoylglutathione lyase